MSTPSSVRGFIEKEGTSLAAAQKFAISYYQETFDNYPEGGYVSNEQLRALIVGSVESGYKFGELNEMKNHAL